MTKLWIRALVVASLGAYGVAAQQAAPPKPAVAAATSAAPESVGISTEGLARLHRGMQGYVDRHEAGGIVTLIAREGKIADVHATGFRTSKARRR
jgi:hypothetical protein